MALAAKWEGWYHKVFSATWYPTPQGVVSADFFFLGSTSMGYVFHTYVTASKKQMVRRKGPLLSPGIIAHWNNEIATAIGNDLKSKNAFGLKVNSTWENTRVLFFVNGI